MALLLLPLLLLLLLLLLQVQVQVQVWRVQVCAGEQVQVPPVAWAQRQRVAVWAVAAWAVAVCCWV